jgi:hypothetical protein
MNDDHNIFIEFIIIKELRYLYTPKRRNNSKSCLIYAAEPASGRSRMRTKTFSIRLTLGKSKTQS